MKKTQVTQGIPGFDWELYMSDSPKLVENKSISKEDGDKSKVYCNNSYAQLLYGMYNGIHNEFTEPTSGSVINGTIVSVNENIAVVDVNWREDAIIDLKKENPEYLKYIQVGFPIEVLIEDVNKKSKFGSIQASYSKNIKQKKKNEIFASIGEPVAYAGTVKELIHGGYFLDVDGTRCFMPGSLGGMNKLVNFESLLGQTIYVVPINYSKEKDYIVVSHREYLKSLIPQEIKKLEFGKQYQGFVTGCSKHGVFVEFNGCLSGLIAKRDIDSDTIQNFESGKIKAGDSISFYISEIIDNDKVCCSQNLPEPKISLWDDIESRYKIPSMVTGKIKKIMRYGVFIEIEPKVVGLLHKSYLDENIDLEVGQEIEVKIIKIDKESKQLDFTM